MSCESRWFTIQPWSWTLNDVVRGGVSPFVVTSNWSRSMRKSIDSAVWLLSNARWKPFRSLAVINCLACGNVNGSRVKNNYTKRPVATVDTSINESLKRGSWALSQSIFTSRLRLLGKESAGRFSQNVHNKIPTFPSVLMGNRISRNIYAFRGDEAYSRVELLLPSMSTADVRRQKSTRLQFLIYFHELKSKTFYKEEQKSLKLFLIQIFSFTRLRIRVSSACV